MQQWLRIEFLWMYICIFVAVRFEFELYIYIYGQIDLNLNYFFSGKSSLQIHTAGAAGDTAALTEVHYRGG